MALCLLYSHCLFLSPSLPPSLPHSGPFDKVTLTLCNPSDKKVGFKMNTTASKQFCVRHNSGIIEPSGEQTMSGDLCITH